MLTAKFCAPSGSKGWQPITDAPLSPPGDAAFDDWVEAIKKRGGLAGRQKNKYRIYRNDVVIWEGQYPFDQPTLYPFAGQALAFSDDLPFRRFRRMR